MVGWMILFALMALGADLFALAGSSEGISAKPVSVVFALLFVVGLLTRLARGRVW